MVDVEDLSQSPGLSARATVPRWHSPPAWAVAVATPPPLETLTSSSVTQELGSSGIRVCFWPRASDGFVIMSKTHVEGDQGVMGWEGERRGPGKGRPSSQGCVVVEPRAAGGAALGRFLGGSFSLILGPTGVERFLVLCVLTADHSGPGGRGAGPGSHVY